MSGVQDGIGSRYAAVRARIDRACERAGRDSAEVVLVAVGKMHSVDRIAEAYDAGCRDFGESRVQEWQQKVSQLPGDIRWHLIGHLQRNKVKYVTDGLHLIHSVDSVRLVKAFERRAEREQDVLVEVNVGLEAAKTGIDPARAGDLVERCARSPVLRPLGLMCIPPWSEDPENSRPYYRRLVEMASEIRERLRSVDEEAAERFAELSMGMTDDFEVAVEEGATIVRVGTAIFGARPAAGKGEAD